EPVPPPQPARSTEPTTFHVSVTVDPDTAAIDLDGVRSAMGHLERTLPLDHTRHTLRIQADGFLARTIEFVDEPPPPRGVLAQAPHPAKTPPTTPAAATRPKKHGPRPPGADDEAPRALNPNGAPLIY